VKLVHLPEQLENAKIDIPIRMMPANGKHALMSARIF
jgi:hypothetical protein